MLVLLTGFVADLVLLLDASCSRDGRLSESERAGDSSVFGVFSLLALRRLCRSLRSSPQDGWTVASWFGVSSLFDLFFLRLWLLVDFDISLFFCFLALRWQAVESSSS